MYNKNENRFYIHSALWYIALMMVNGSVMQTCLLELGISSEAVSFLVSIFQAAQVGTMLLFSSKAERIKNIIFSYAVTYLIQICVLIAILIICWFKNINLNLKYYIILTTGLIASVALGFNTVIAYKIPYHIIDMRNYGILTGISGTICGFAGIVFSAVLSFFLNRYSYFSVIKVFYIIAILLTVVTAVIVLKFRDNGYKSVGKDNSNKISLFKYKPFSVLLVPNFLRGFNSGAMGLMITIGYHLNVINSMSAGYLIIITNVAVIGSCLLYSYISKYNKDNWVILISSITVAVTMPLMIINKNTMSFLILYAFAYFAYIFINYSVPVLITKIVDYNIVGQYSAWRMLLHTAGSALAGVLCIPMIDLLGSLQALIIIGLTQLISGITYFIYSSNNKTIQKAVMD